ncbi:TolC family protein [Olivibacter sp. SDN3]|uniref:TolC family protein n=1 Tax=Olivibacter sp. SDN3 TaxID=2764720 RepID=UPI002102DEBD|nr:TolC family protein [Olivibacter sp. SDN3]
MPLALTNGLEAQEILSLKEALNTAVNNYSTVKAKENFAQAARLSAEHAKREYLPNLVLSGQQDYGTINGQNGPLYGFGGYGVASSGLPLPNQNWNAAFGSLYLANINWDFFAFGRAKERIKVAQQTADRENRDLQQELFNHQVKVAAAYLNLLAAQKLTQSYEKNLHRADTFRQVVVTRASNGLIAGVDSSLANAEVSNAKIAFTNAKDTEQEQANSLAQLMGVPAQEFILDSIFISNVPRDIEHVVTLDLKAHPVLQWYQSRINVGEEQSKYLKTFYYPTFSLIGVMQTRGSGFYSDYAVNQTSYTQNYFEGIKPTRSNYLIGIGLTWNITQPLRVSKQLKAQDFNNRALANEYELANQQLSAQLVLADTKIQNALSNYREVPTQIKAASDAFLQKTVLYKNGLTNLVDVTQALYALIRAETDRDIAYNNLWQALLYKAAAAGDFSLFIDKVTS